MVAERRFVRDRAPKRLITARINGLPIMPHFRCQSISGPGKHAVHKSAGPSGQTWARYLRAGSAANLHRLRHALPKHLRQNQHSFVLFASSSSAHAATRSPKASAHSETEILDCVIVGAGISGLTLAQAFSSEHPRSVGKVLITEAQDRVGGNITSKKSDGFLYETGPNSFQPGDPVLKLAVSLLPAVQSFTPRIASAHMHCSKMLKSSLFLRWMWVSLMTSNLATPSRPVLYSGTESCVQLHQGLMC